MVECNILQCSDTAVSSPNHWCYTDLCLIQLSVMLHSGWWSNIYYTVGGSVLIQQPYTPLIKCSVMLHTVEGGAPIVWTSGKAPLWPLSESKGSSSSQWQAFHTATLS